MRKIILGSLLLGALTAGIAERMLQKNRMC